MGIKQIIDPKLDKLKTEKEQLRTWFFAELELLGGKAKTAAQHEASEAEALPMLTWIETSMARLRELRGEEGAGS